MDYLKQLIVPALTALVVVLLVLWLGSFKGQMFGAASTLGTNNIPTTLTGGSAPTVFNALEATESFISDGTAYFLNGTLFFGGTTNTTANRLITTRQALNTATTTVCAIEAPNATSTLLFASLVETVSSSTAGTITFAYNAATTATAPSATSSQIGPQALTGASLQFTLLASTTAATTTSPTVFPPSTWMVISQGGGLGTFSPTGFCTAQFLTF